jgi:hypothetical protein
VRSSFVTAGHGCRRRYLATADWLTEIPNKISIDTIYYSVVDQCAKVVDRKKQPKLARLELQVLEALWAHGKACPSCDQVSSAGRSQGIAFVFGRGRVVIIGEMGALVDYSVPGMQNRQFTLNAARWLAREL